MTEKTPITVSEPEWERGLGWMVLVSLAIHLALIAVILLLPTTLLRQPPPPLVSYTVDLIAPDKVGGTNVLEGGKGRLAAAPLAAAPEAPGDEAPKAPEPKPEAPREAAKQEPPVPEEPKAEPPQVEPEPQEAREPEPKPPVEEAVKKDEMVLAMKATPRIEPPPVPTARPPEPTVAEPPPTRPKPPPTLAKAPPTPAAKPAASPKAVAKAQPTAAATAPRPDAKATEARKVAEARATAEAKKAAEARAAAEAKLAAEAKAAAEAKMAAEAKAAAEARATEAKKRDEQIAAAVRRAEQRVGERGGGTGTAADEQPGGAIAVGPGEGAGGAVAGVEYLLYYNQMISRIKASWAWASRGRALEAVIRFSISETGEVLNVRIVRASGDASFDASVERAVRAVNPLPAPPVAYRKEFADVELTFRPEDLKM